ncbi:MAG: MFS transporter [Planctomycetes bacterium]|nr:MFS transporter [Planctomycetota bacterium]
MIRAARNIVATYRDAFGGLPAITWLLCFAAFVNRCGSMVLPLLSLYLLAKFGYTAGEAGEVVAFYGMGAVFGSVLGGKLADRLGCVRVQIVTLAGAGCWMFLMAQITAAWLLAPATFVLGVINDAFRPGSITAVATSVGPELRRKALSLNRLMMNAGWAVGPTVGGNLVEHFDYSVMFWADGGTCLLAAAFLFVFLRGFTPRTATPSDGDASKAIAAAAHLRGPFRDLHFLWLMFVNFVVITAFMQYFTTGTRVLKQDYGYPESTIFWLIAINPLLITLTEMPIVHTLRRHAALPIVALGSLVIGAGFLLYLLPLGATGVILALAVITIGEVLQMALLGSYINDYAPERRRGAYNGAYGMSFSLALVAAPAVGGWLYDGAGARVLWTCCAIAGLLGAIGFLASHRKRREHHSLGPT